MRQIEPQNPTAEGATKSAMRALRIGAIVLGIGLIVGTGQVRAEDDVDEDVDSQKSFERGVVDNIMSSIGGRRIEDGTIQYRERSPLVIPSNTSQLPAPEARKAKLAPNWPKDPDVAERKRLLEEAKKPAMSPEQARMPLMPSELAAKSSRRKTDTSAASNSNNPSTSSFMLSPSQLGYSGGLFSNPFGSQKEETATFTGEPERNDLTEPPKGYQTPSPNFAYGTGPSKGKELICDSASGQCEKRDIR